MKIIWKSEWPNRLACCGLGTVLGFLIAGPFFPESEFIKDYQTLISVLAATAIGLLAVKSTQDQHALAKEIHDQQRNEALRRVALRVEQHCNPFKYATINIDIDGSPLRTSEEIAKLVEQAGTFDLAAEFRNEVCLKFGEAAVEDLGVISHKIGYTLAGEGNYSWDDICAALFAVTAWYSNFAMGKVDLPYKQIVDDN